MLTRRRALIGGAATLFTAAAPAIIRPASADLLVDPVFATNAPAACFDPGLPIGILDGLSPSGAWSASRKLFTAYAGSFYTVASGLVTTLFDQSPNLFNLSQSFPDVKFYPSVSCAVYPPLGLLYNGLDNDLTSGAVPMSSFMSLSTGYMIASVRPTSFPTDNPIGYPNSHIIMDGHENLGMTVSNNSGSPLYWANTWGGSPNQVSNPIAANTTFVLELRHEAGILYNRVNGVGETSVVAGNTTELATALHLGGIFTLASNSFAGYIFEAAIFPTPPVLAVRNALVQSFGLYAGAAV